MPNPSAFLRSFCVWPVLVLGACGSGVGNGSNTGTSGATGTTATPTVSLTASPSSVSSGGTSMLKWTSANATSCAASGAWSGAQATSGTETTSPLTASATFTLTCTGSGGASSGSVTVTVASSSNPAPTAASASTVGPYTVQTYTTGIAVPNGSHYEIPKIWYPVEAAGPYPGVIFVPGLNSSYTEPPYTVVINGATVVEADITQYGTFFASHGFAVMFIDTVNYGANPEERSTALLEAVAAFAAEATRSGSPLFGKLDASNIAVMGHSFGGAGALYAANANSEPRIKAAIGLSPVPDVGYFPDIKVPSLIIAGVGDPYFSDFAGEYASIPDTTPKILAEFSQSPEFQSMHAIALTPLGVHTTDPIVARIGLSFIEVYLMGDARYQPFLISDPSMSTFSYNP